MYVLMPDAEWQITWTENRPVSDRGYASRRQGSGQKSTCPASGNAMRNSHDPGRVAASSLGVRAGQHLNGQIPLGTATALYRCHRQGHEDPSFPRVF